MVSGFSRTWRDYCSHRGMFPKHPVPLANFDYIGPHRYFLTWCCFERQPLFAERVAVDLVLSQILRACQPSGIVIIAYCFMPDHVHFLVEGQRPDSNARRFFSLAKQYAGYAYSKQVGGRLWQRYGFEHIVRSDQTSKTVTCYILENPVRAGLATNLQDWQSSGSPAYDLRALIE